MQLRVRLKTTNNGNIAATMGTLRHAGFATSSTLAKALRELETVQYGKPLESGEDDIGALMGQFSDDVEKAWAGDMRRAEAMLFDQAQALQATFMNLSRRASSQEYLKQLEAYLRMALMAQNLCRMTLETLATIENPPVVIARQANINNGGQQQMNKGGWHASAQRPAKLARGEHAGRANRTIGEAAWARAGHWSAEPSRRS